MKTNQKTSKKLLLATSALSLGFLAGGFALLGGEKAAAEDQPVIPTNCEISVESGTSLKLNDHGGLRFIFKMNTAMKEYIKDNDTNDSVKLIAHVGPKGHIADKFVPCTIAEDKLYSDREGNWYANVCLVGVRPQNRELEYTAQAFVKNGETVVKTAENAKASGSFYDVATRALLDTEEDYTQRILNLSSYSWLGDETHPLMIDNLELYNALVAKVNAGNDFSEMYMVIGDSVSMNESDFEGKKAPAKLNVVTYMDGDKLLGTEYVKNGEAANPATPENRKVENGTEVFEKWVTKKGGDTEADLRSISGNVTVYAKFRTVHSNSISWSVAPHDISYGVTPDFAATAGYGTPELTYATAQNGEYKAWAEIEHNVGTYYVKASVKATNEYAGAEATASFEITKASNSLEITMTEKIYCGTNPAPSVKAAFGADTVVYAYGKDTDASQNWEFADVKWEKANVIGNFYYKVKATIPETSNYEGASKVVTFKVEHDFQNGVLKDGVPQDGICKHCGKSQTGITYEINGDEAYIAKYTGNPSTEVYPLAVYTEGGKTYNVTSVKNTCKWNNITAKIVLPESVTDFKGLSFMHASNLEYISMTGVKTLTTNNNFLDCTKLTTVIVNKDFLLNDQQFKNRIEGYDHKDAKCIVYVNGAADESTYNCTTGYESLNNVLSGIIYYKGDATKCLQWNYDSNGEIIHGAAEHNYEAGICTACGKYSEEKTQGVVYGYDATENNGKGGYYVGLNQTLNLSVVEILGTYNDGIHGELSVTYVRNSAFNGNPYITKVILPESVTQLDGNVFLNCSNLQYVSMLGIKNMTFKGISRLYSTETIITGNNFLGCSKLTTLIVNKAFNLFDDPLALNAQQFVGSDACINIYAFGGKDDSNVIISKEGTTGNNNLLTGTIYYYSETQKSGCWHYVDDNGNVAIWE